MALNKPNQQLRRELKDLSIGLEQAAVDVLELTKGCEATEVVAALKLIAKLYEDADRIAALADEVKAGKIIWSKDEP